MELDLKFHPQRESSKKSKKIEEFLIDEALIKVVLIWMTIGVAIESKSKDNLQIGISLEHNTLMPEHFI